MAESMFEFEVFRMALERLGYDILVSQWVIDNRWSALIEDNTNQIDYWFRDGSLERIDNNQNNF